MRKILGIAATTVWLLATAACALTMSVGSHVEPGLDLSRYRTFEWGPADALPTGDARLDKSPFFKDRVQGAVERGLYAKGLQLTTAKSPDLLVHWNTRQARSSSTSSTHAATS
jgi:hypothetical protein